MPCCLILSVVRGGGLPDKVGQQVSTTNTLPPMHQPALLYQALKYQGRFLQFGLCGTEMLLLVSDDPGVTQPHRLTVSLPLDVGKDQKRSVTSYLPG